MLRSKLGKNYNFKILHPELTKQWHPTKNGKHKPEDFAPFSSVKVWWKCDKGIDHEWDSKIVNRTGSKRAGCPFCSRHRIGKDNNFSFLFPDIAKQWHPTKNGKHKPEDFAPGSNTKVWFKCKKGHTWQTSIEHRCGKRKTGCPKCTNQTSKGEIRVYTELKKLFPGVINRYKDIKELDIFIPSLKVGIEYDGNRWHSDINTDKQKNKLFAKKGIAIIRLREDLEKISEFDFILKKSHNTGPAGDKELISGIKHILNYVLNNYEVDKKTKINITKYLKRKAYINDKEYRKYLSFYPLPIPENSLLKTHPKLSKEWDYKKNAPLAPEYFTYGAHEDAWWLCDKAGHSFKTRISHRTGSGVICPYCTGRKVSSTNNLKYKYPAYSKYWHPTMNGNIKPKKIVAGAAYNAWWRCPKGHEWKLNLRDLAKRKNKEIHEFCPYCRGLYPSKNNNLKVLYPEIAKKWHPTKNGKRQPEQYLPGSDAVIWWKCDKGEDHEWKSVIDSRTRKGVYKLKDGTRKRQLDHRGCPYCAGKKVSKTNNLVYLYPDLVKQWHPTKNGNLTPDKITKGYSKNVWWKCDKGEDHEWSTTVGSRRDLKNSCPFCTGRKASKSRNFKVLNPEYSKYWHPTKNGNLLPEDFTPSSGVKIWWKCDKNHEITRPLNKCSKRNFHCSDCKNDSLKLKHRNYKPKQKTEDILKILRYIRDDGLTIVETAKMLNLSTYITERIYYRFVDDKFT